MNVLFLFDYPVIPYQGGVQRVTDILAKEMIKRCYNVVFVSYSKNNKDDNYYNFAAKQYYINPNMGKNKALVHLNNILIENDVDLVINQMATIESFFFLKMIFLKNITVFHGMPFAELYKEKKILQNWTPNTIKGYVFKYSSLLFPIVARKYYLNVHKKYFEEAIKTSNKFCLLSDRFIPRLLNNTSIEKSNKIVAINNPNTINISTVNFSHKENIILCVGRITEVSKNMVDFLKVWKILSTKNSEWEAYIIGDGPDLERLRKFTKKESIERVFFEGQTSNVQEYYKRAKFICVTSIFEGWSMVLTEGMSYGCVPCSYNSYEAIYDIIDDGECGCIIDIFDIQMMANRLQLLINDDKERIRLAKNAIEKMKNFSTEKIVDKWELLIKSI
jgi:glycosyltransferase involved in cell wall biosynthesis